MLIGIGAYLALVLAQLGLFYWLDKKLALDAVVLFLFFGWITWILVIIFCITHGDEIIICQKRDKLAKPAHEPTKEVKSDDN